MIKVHQRGGGGGGECVTIAYIEQNIMFRMLETHIFIVLPECLLVVHMHCSIVCIAH